MNKIFLIIKREYLSRVKKKSFILMTILGPILMAGIMIVPIWFAMQKPDLQKIEVIDDSHLFEGLIPQKDFVHFDYPPITLEQAQEGFYDTNYDAILWISKNILEGKGAVTIFYKKQLGVAVEQHIHTTLSKMMYDVMLAKNKVNLDAIKSAEVASSFKMITKELEASGKSKETNTGVRIGIGLASGILIYMFIFLYGVQVMRGVMEEKTNRIVEVILSSVKPFQLMMGKIIGVALVGLTQFILWLVLTGTLYSVASATLLKDIDLKQIQQKEEVIKIGSDINFSKMKSNPQADEITKIWNDLKTIDFSVIMFCFLFYFLGGYLLYSALFAAMGAAVDNEADTQQFMLPVTIPIIFSIVMAQTIIQDPSGPIGFWLSIIPFTSPIIMMVRLPFGVPGWELALSMILLVLGFLFTTWLAGRIYRTGILMYGKKVTWKELGKWLFYKG